MNYLKRLLLMSASTIVISGCQNFVKDEVLKEKKIERSEPTVNYYLNVSQEVVDKPIVKLTLTKESACEVTEFEDLVKEEFYTPYRGVNESYEIISGILILPGAIVVNVVDFATLGLIPNEFTDDLLDLSFTGMNPALNWESEDRLVTNVISTESKEVDKRDEVVKRAAANEKITIEGELLKVDSITTDKKGVARIYLHDRSLKFLDNIEKLRELDVYVRKGEPSETSVKLLLERGLRMRLIMAKKLIKEYEANKSGASLAKLALKIEGIKFPRLALELERKELDSHAKDKEFVKAFNDEMVKQAANFQ